MGDEGGFAPNLPCSEDAIAVILRQLKKPAMSRAKMFTLRWTVLLQNFDSGFYKMEGAVRNSSEFADYLYGLSERHL